MLSHKLDNMEQNVGYIKNIRITGLWGKQDISWNLRPDVNILSGINGSGKSSILRAVYQTLISGKEICVENSIFLSKIQICFSNSEDVLDSTDILFINNFDRPLIDSGSIQKLSDKRVKTELDWQLYKLQSAYLSYQVNIGNRIIRLLSSDDIASKEKAASISSKKLLFQDVIDDLFCATNKRIDRSKNEIQFISGNDTLSPYQLSAGEKQILVILLTVLIQDEKPCILLMDEPEISLHIEWQKKLINLIRDLNQKVQIILATHSPAVIMNGWIDAVTEVSDISSISEK